MLYNAIHIVATCIIQPIFHSYQGLTVRDVV